MTGLIHKLLMIGRNNNNDGDCSIAIDTKSNDKVSNRPSPLDILKVLRYELDGGFYTALGFCHQRGQSSVIR